MNNKVAKIITTAAVTTIAGLALIDNNVKADTTTTTDTTVQHVVTQPTQSAMASSLNLYSNNLTQVQNTQNINFPAGYTLDAIRNINNTDAANAFEQDVARQGLYTNNYDSDATAAQEKVDINNLTPDQVEEMNQYGLSLVNQARAEFGKEPFNQDAATINQVRKMALQYQDKDESLLKGSWHDETILQGKSENIATYQVYADNISGLTVRPFASAKGNDFIDNNAVPLFSLTTMDDLRALIYYGIMGMFFNDADDHFGHAQNFLTFDQPITTMALYPSLTYSDGSGRWSNGASFTFKLENIDMHYIWVEGNDYTTSDFTNSGTVVTPYNESDNGNYAYLDSAYLNNNGVLVASGWHTANAAKGRPYRYLIAVDQNGKELGRTKISNILRPDVQQTYNVYKASYSGFSSQIDLESKLAGVTSIQLISRYSASADGNSDYLDYYFTPIIVDRGNYGYLDGATINNGQLQVSGWNTTNLSLGKDYHYIIILNNGREVSRALVEEGTERSDVANVYPHIVGANKSGFKVDFDLNKIDFNQQVEIISRYTNDPVGNGNYVDYWFTPLTTGHFSNQANLDSFNISNNQLNIVGWHATGISQFEQNHFIILFDKTDNRQVASFYVSAVERPDVQKVYSTVKNSIHSGFYLNLDLGQLPLVPGHQYAVVSRYSTSNEGNGDSGKYTDYWFAPQVLLNEEENGYLDDWSITRQNTGMYQLIVSGWRATNMTNGYHTLILYDNTRGSEVMRQAVTTNIARPDVARIYGNQYLNAGQSGFNTTLTVPSTLRLGDDYTILDRYSLTQDANEDYVDVPLHIGAITAADIK